MRPIGSSTSSGTHTGTPPSASTIVLKPLKSTTTKWFTRSPDIVSNCATVQASPPRANASFHCENSSPGIVEPSSGLMQSGRSTIRSRGMLTPYARSRSAERWSRIVVSDSPALAPDTPDWPSRVSDPRISTLSGLFGPSTSTSSGRSPWMTSKPFETVMFPSRCR
jgi:hypothetical protein